jgi:predicted acylesterase/phospholipase RssA
LVANVRSSARFLAVWLCLLTLAGCTTVLIRAPAPEAGLDEARPYGIESAFIRAWGDALDSASADALIEGRIAMLRDVLADRPASVAAIESPMLALSGGGPDGAFGAGLLAGWAARGDRPDFTVVSGVSTGAIIALFAFLGPEYDPVLRDIYTNYATRDLLTPAFLRGLLRGSAVTDTTGFRRLIEQYVDETVVARLAEEHRRGRLLLIGTTNLDATRPVVWNIGEIAATGHPEARRLIRDVIEASAAIPGAFPPVFIPVEIDGRRFDEMHVDGGTTRQVLLFSPDLRQRRVDEALGIDFERQLYVIVNNKLQKPYAPVAPRLRPITATAVSSLIAGAGLGDTVQLYLTAAREGIPLRMISIPPGFDAVAQEPFDKAYMRALYDLGFAMGRDGIPWRSTPPGLPQTVDASAALSR